MGTLIVETWNKRRQNLFIRSEEFIDSIWGKINISVNSNVGSAPDGTQSADRSVPSAGLSSKTIFQHLFLPSITTTSIYAKADGYRYVQLNWSNTYSTAFVNYDLITGTVGTQDQTTGFIRNVGNGWFRLGATVSGTPGEGRGPGLTTVSVLTAPRGGSMNADGNGGILIWGAQVNEGHRLLPYKKTENTIFNP